MHACIEYGMYVLIRPVVQKYPVGQAARTRPANHLTVRCFSIQFSNLKIGRPPGGQAVGG